MLKKMTLGAIGFVSMFFRALGWRACRFYPTCSEYAHESFERYHFFRALGQSARRFFRCHPFSAGGYDPVTVRHPEQSEGS